jgi:hypothetical protein
MHVLIHTFVGFHLLASLSIYKSLGNSYLTVYKKILVAVDGSEASLKALKHAVELA